jgi:hypothetical protein
MSRYHATPELSVMYMTQVDWNRLVVTNEAGAGLPDLPVRLRLVS